MAKPTVLALLLLCLLTACGGSHDAARDGGVVACSWPMQYGVTDAGYTGACVAARYLLDCMDPSTGVSEICRSGEEDACPSDPSGVSGSFTSCKSDCADDEYAVECGSVTSNTDLPSGCRSLGATPAGVVFGCCPCD